MVIDPVSRELKSPDHKIVDIGGQRSGFKKKTPCKTEMHPGRGGSGTGHLPQCTEEARLDISRLAKYVSDAAESLGLRLARCRHPPVSHWDKQLITPNPRYLWNREWNARGRAFQPNFGLHVHVGIHWQEHGHPSWTRCATFAARVRAEHELAVLGKAATQGFKSFRTKVFDKFPRRFARYV